MFARLTQTLNPGRRAQPAARALSAPANDNRRARAPARLAGGKRPLACRWHLDATGRLACRWAVEEGADEPAQPRRRLLCSDLTGSRKRRYLPRRSRKAS